MTLHASHDNDMAASQGSECTPREVLAHGRHSHLHRLLAALFAASLAALGLVGLGGSRTRDKARDRTRPDRVETRRRRRRCGPVKKNTCPFSLTRRVTAHLKATTPAPDVWTNGRLHCFSEGRSRVDSSRATHETHVSELHGRRRATIKQRGSNDTRQLRLERWGLSGD